MSLVSLRRASGPLARFPCTSAWGGAGGRSLVAVRVVLRTGDSGCAEPLGASRDSIAPRALPCPLGGTFRLGEAFGRVCERPLVPSGCLGGLPPASPGDEPAASGQTNHATAAVPASRSAPRLPASAPCQAPATTTGSVAACRSHRIMALGLGGPVPQSTPGPSAMRQRARAPAARNPGIGAASAQSSLETGQVRQQVLLARPPVIPRFAHPDIGFAFAGCRAFDAALRVALSPRVSHSRHRA